MYNSVLPVRSVRSCRSDDLQRKRREGHEEIDDDGSQSARVTFTYRSISDEGVQAGNKYVAEKDRTCGENGTKLVVHLASEASASPSDGVSPAK